MSLDFPRAFGQLPDLHYAEHVTVPFAFSSTAAQRYVFLIGQPGLAVPNDIEAPELGALGRLRGVISTAARLETDGHNPAAAHDFRHLALLREAEYFDAIRFYAFFYTESRLRPMSQAEFDEYVRLGFRDATHIQNLHELRVTEELLPQLGITAKQCERLPAYDARMKITETLAAATPRARIRAAAHVIFVPPSRSLRLRRSPGVHRLARSDVPLRDTPQSRGRSAPRRPGAAS